jgi:hypothetical protein
MTTMARQVCEYYVIHPLDDALEEKRTGEGLSRMQMTPSVRLSLLALRGYLILMTGLVFYRVLDLCGALAHHAVH